VKKFSRIRYPNRAQRRRAYFTSSLNVFMSRIVFPPRRLKAISDNIFRATPILDFLNKEEMRDQAQI
jgi:hypothetical protein